MATFPAVLEGVRTAPYWSPQIRLSANQLAIAFKLKLRVSRKTSNIIYLIQCRKCGLQFVGETRQPLLDRMTSHHFDIVHCQTDISPVAAHFTSKHHSVTDLSVIIIDVCWKEATILRKIRQSRWIRTLGTSWPSSLNLRTDSLQCTCFPHLSSRMKKTTPIFTYWK